MVADHSLHISERPRGPPCGCPTSSQGIGIRKDEVGIGYHCILVLQSNVGLSADIHRKHIEIDVNLAQSVGTVIVAAL